LILPLSVFNSTTTPEKDRGMKERGMPRKREREGERENGKKREREREREKERETEAYPGGPE